MKKSRLVLVSLILFSILIISLSFVSANWFSDIWGKITGKSISGNAVTGYNAYGVSCGDLITQHGMQDALQGVASSSCKKEDVACGDFWIDLGTTYDYAGNIDCYRCCARWFDDPRDAAYSTRNSVSSENAGDGVSCGDLIAKQERQGGSGDCIMDNDPKHRTKCDPGYTDLGASNWPGSTRECNHCCVKWPMESSTESSTSTSSGENQITCGSLGGACRRSCASNEEEIGRYDDCRRKVCCIKKETVVIPSGPSCSQITDEKSNGRKVLDKKCADSCPSEPGWESLGDASDCSKSCCGKYEVSSSSSESVSSSLPECNQKGGDYYYCGAGYTFTRSVRPSYAPIVYRENSGYSCVKTFLCPNFSCDVALPVLGPQFQHDFFAEWNACSSLDMNSRDICWGNAVRRREEAKQETIRLQTEYDAQLGRCLTCEDYIGQDLLYGVSNNEVCCDKKPHISAGGIDKVYKTVENGITYYHKYYQCRQ